MTDFKLRNTTKERKKERQKKSFQFLLYKKSNNQVLFKLKQMSQQSLLCYWGELGEILSPCSGDQWLQGGNIIKVHSTNRGFFFFSFLLNIGCFSVIKPQLRSSTNSYIQTSNHIEQRLDLFSTLKQVDFLSQKWNVLLSQVKFTQIHVSTR